MKKLILSILKKMGLYDFLKEKKKLYEKNKKLTNKYLFENRKQNKRKVCFVLAGYKPFLYEIVFKRIKKYATKDMEVCILSSGVYSEELSNIAKENNWSYISTKQNNVSLIQNVAINLFDKAEYIYKLDEDIFITQNYFETLMKTLNECEEVGEYKVGFVAPTIPINGFGHLNILKRFNLVEYYTKNYEKPLYAAGRDMKVEDDPSVAKFFWGENNLLPQLDEMNKVLQSDKFDYVPCSIRFSIGAILFKRKFFEDMQMFLVKKTSGLGDDEKQICEYCINTSQSIIVSKNVVVGHLSFKNQNAAMKEYFLNNKNIFDVNEKL